MSMRSNVTAVALRLLKETVIKLAVALWSQTSFGSACLSQYFWISMKKCVSTAPSLSCILVVCNTLAEVGVTVILMISAGQLAAAATLVAIASSTFGSPAKLLELLTEIIMSPFMLSASGANVPAGMAFGSDALALAPDALNIISWPPAWLSFPMVQFP